MDTRPQVELSYRALFDVRGFRRFASTMLLGRGAEQMWVVVMVLFVLQKFHSPALAGVVFFMGVTPGLLLSPLAGALIDRYGRSRLITLDYFVATFSLLAIALLSMTGRLTPALLVPLVVLGGVTGMLSAAGLRSMLPLLLPQPLWDRGNGFDSAGYTVVAIAAPALGGALVGAAGGDFALLTTAAAFAAAGLSIVGMAEPRQAADSEGALLARAAAALRYVLRSATLRGLAITLLVVNTGAGIVVVALPVIVLGPAHGTPALVGLVFALQGAGGVVSALVFGRFDSRGRERIVIAICALAGALGVAMMLVPALPWVAAGSLVIGLATGPMDVCIFSLRQRSIDAAWMGRAIAVSMSLNFLGFPIGSAISGPLLQVGLGLTLGVSAILVAAGAVVALLAVPRPTAAA